MEVLSTCPLRVASMIWQPAPGAWMLTVVCKALFQLEPLECRLVDPQEDPAEEDGYWDDDEAKSLYAPSDLVPFKARADVQLVGHAFAPRGQPVRSLVTRLVVGGVDKRIEVWCDRIFWQDGRVLEGPPFAWMPLRYERAAGGPATANPVGMRFDAPPDAYGAVPIPNLQAPAIRVAARGDTFDPIGFGPIAPTWPERVERLGRHAAEWSRRTWSTRPLPADIDAACFNSAPRDQQVELLRPDEPILLENLHAEHPRLETKLPGIRPRVLVKTGTGATKKVPLIADTLAIDTDRALVALVWRGSVTLVNPRETGQVLVSMEGPAARSVEAPDDALATVPVSFKRRATLPFTAAQSPWAGFRSEPPPSREPAVPITGTGTLHFTVEASGPVIPFASDPPAAPQETPRLLRSEPPAALSEPPRLLRSEPPAALSEPPRLLRSEPPAAVLEAPFLLRSEPPAAPPEALVEAPAVPLPPEPPKAPTPAPQPVDLPLERCAAIAASLARTPAETARILEANGLDAAAWAALDRRWNEAIRDETRKGKATLLAAFDEAYLAQLEQERGAIQVEDIARLVVAAERGSLPQALAGMTLPREAMLRIERVWLRRTGKDAALAKQLKRATKAAREEG